MKPVHWPYLPQNVIDPGAVSVFVYARLAMTLDGETLSWTQNDYRIKLWRMSNGTLRMNGHVFAPADDVPDGVEWVELRCGVSGCRSPHCKAFHRLLVRRKDYLKLTSK